MVPPHGVGRGRCPASKTPVDADFAVYVCVCIVCMRMYLYVCVCICMYHMYLYVLYVLVCIFALSVCMAWIFTEDTAKSQKSSLERRDQPGWSHYTLGHVPISFCRYSETLPLTDFGAPALNTRVLE